MTQDVNGYLRPRVCRQSGSRDCSCGGKIAVGVNGNGPVAEPQAEAVPAAGNVNDILKGIVASP